MLGFPHPMTPRKGTRMAARNSSRRLAVVVLAAGKGKRMKSSRPKVLHEVSGRPSLWHVLQAAMAGRPDRLVVVVHHGADEVRAVAEAWKLKPSPVFVEQEEALGTGHAAAAAEEAVRRADDVLVLPGDDPLVRSQDVRAVLATHRRTGAAATIAVTEVDDPRGYARVVRKGNRLSGLVVEDVADADPKLRKVREVSTLVYAFRREDLFRALPLVSRDNSQREYYLPDVISILLDKGERVSAVPVDWGGSMGLNSRGGLARVARVMRERIVAEHLAKGVTFVDPATAYVDAGVKIGGDATILPMTVLQGETRIGARATIGPDTRIVDSTIGDDAEVTFSVVRGSRIGRSATVGPFTSLRPGTVIGEGGKAGSFVEIKASRVGKRSKVPHLSYVGDATLGDDVNIGAGTVTVNYDGFRKNATQVGHGAHIGSDTMLVAPVRVGKRAWTGAGSVITKDVPDGALAVERTDQRNVPGYDRRKREKEEARARTEARSKGTGSGKRTPGGGRRSG
jgi:bifunctional UDP-N-acetylglucosamine pyrophosphorylase/glucosamine-1-phosphate N-acetyltransferase